MLRRKKIIFLIILFNVPKFLFSQSFGNIQVHTMPSALCETDLSITDNTLNPANISFVENFAFSLSYSPSRFGLEELSPLSAIGVYSFQNLSIGASLFNLGNELYREFSTSFIVSYSAYDDFILALSAEYDRIDIQDYRNDALVAFNLGTRVNLSEQLHAAFVLRNLNNARFEGVDNKVFRLGVLGLGYRMNEKFYYGINAVIHFEYSSSFNFNIVYNPIETIAIKIGAMTNPRSIELEISSTAIDRFGINFGLYYHDYLGIIQNYGVEYYSSTK